MSRPSPLRPALTALPALAAAAALAAPATADVVVQDAALDGDQVQPPSGSPGSGEATVTIDDASGYVHVAGTYRDLEGVVLFMHLHGPGDGTPNGGTLITLASSGGQAGRFEGAARLPLEDVADLLAGKGYVNIHTNLHPAGEIRGDLGPAPVARTIALDGDQLDPPSGSAGHGAARVTVDPAERTVTVEGRYAGLDGAASAAELRGPARPGEDGPLLLTLGVTGGTQGDLTGAGQVKKKDLPALLAGGGYLLLRSAAHPAGELRGQVDDGQVGTPYCAPYPNATGVPGRLVAVGSARVADGDLTLEATDLPPGALAWPLVGTGSAQLLLPGPALTGRLCVAGGVLGRATTLARESDATGAATFPLDPAHLPLTPPIAARPGDTWCFQVAYRDGKGGQLTNAVAVTFR